MKKNLSISLSIKWLTLGLMALALLTLAFTGDKGDTEPAHCNPCVTPTFTPTPTPRPPRQACRVAEVIFDQANYEAGEPMQIRVRVVDALGQPLTGAKVDATVTRSDPSAQAAVTPLDTLKDLAGYYDGVYLQTETPGDYTFKFAVSDFSGTRFLPCSAERTVPVIPKPRCEIYDVVPPENTPVNRNQPLTLTARVRLINGPEQCNARVSAEVAKPDGSKDSPLEFNGGCPYTLTYTPLSTGTHTFDISAAARDGSFESCRLVPPRSIQVVEPRCSVSLETRPNPLIIGDTLGLTATLTNAICSNGATTAIQVPGDGVVTLTPPLTGTANVCVGSYSPPVTGTYTITTTVTSPGGTCSDTKTVTVNPTPTPQPTPLVAVKLISPTIDLCGSGPDTSGTISVSNVTNLTGVGLEVSYDKSFIQVIDAFNRPNRPVQVKPDPNFDPFQRNEVNTNQGKIFFTANARTPVTGQSDVIFVNWRLQGRTGVTPISATAVLTDSGGTQTVTQVATLTVIINSVCSQGTVILQGRTDHSGVTVVGSNGEQAQTFANGLFAIAPADQLDFTFPGYLPAQLDRPHSAAAAEAITLLAGDVNSDRVIDILDLAFLAGRYQSADPSADLNADGTVNILDLALVAGNYQQRAAPE